MTYTATLFTGEGEELTDLPNNINITQRYNVINFVRELFNGKDFTSPEKTDMVIVYGNEQVDGEYGVEGYYAESETPVVRIIDDPSNVMKESYAGLNAIPMITVPRYTFVLPTQEIETRGWSMVESLITDYQKITGEEMTPERLIELFNPPDETAEDALKNSATGNNSEFLGTFKTRRDQSKFWVDVILGWFLNTPGFLRSHTRTASGLGITEESFNVSLLSNDYEYTGVFDYYVSDLYWYYSCMLEAHDSDILDNLKQATCAKCGRTGVDRAAKYEPVSGKELVVPVHYKCSNVVQSRPGSYQDVRTVELQDTECPN